MITIQAFPYMKYEGRLFRAVRTEHTLVIEYQAKTADSGTQSLTIPIKALSELEELVSNIQFSIKGE